MTNYAETMMWKEISQTPEVFGTIKAKNADIMAELVREIEEKNIRNITGAARGTSDHALIFFKYLMEVFTDLKVGLGACSAVTMYDGKVNYGDNLVVGVSQSGKAADVIAVLERAKSQGAVTLAITNNCDSPMAKVAKYHLCCNAGAEVSVAATKTFSSQAFIMLYLASQISKNKMLIDCLDSLATFVKESFDSVKQQAFNLSNNLKGIKDGFVLARGISYAIALESTLKLQETSYILMKGYAESDFQHGPMAMVGSGTPIIIYVPTLGFVSPELEKNHTAAFRATISRLKGFGGNVFVVTDNNQYDDLAPTFNIGKSEYGEPQTFFKFALFAQMLACFVSCGIGNNPDSPRALNKVTITK